ncbi:MAG TPA: ABC transporter substrate-binding protein [Stellaceae bacterium]|jgi:sulfonate transport system substrate-binding protein|nr:ABC transporter substrate-binding protein [Stellaceae bacterium]
MTRLLIAAALLLMLCRAADADPLTIRTGWVVATSGYSPLPLEKKDLLKHYGKSYVMEPQHFQGTAPQLTAFAGGQIDIATIGYSTFALAVLNAKMEDIRIVADGFQDGADGYNSTAFMVRNDSGIAKVEDLKGKVVASNGFGGAYDVGMRSMLRKHGLEDKRDYSVIESDFGHMNAVLLERKASLIIGSMPFLLDPEMQANAHKLFTLRDAMGRTQMIVLAARQGFLDKNRAALGDFFEDMLAAFRWFHDPKNHAEAIAVAAKVTHQPAEQLGRYLWSDKDFYYDRNGLPDLDALQRNINALHDLDMIKGDVEVKKYADLSFIKEAAQRLN